MRRRTALLAACLLVTLALGAARPAHAAPAVPNGTADCLLGLYVSADGKTAVWECDDVEPDDDSADCCDL